MFFWILKKNVQSWLQVLQRWLTNTGSNYSNEQTHVGPTLEANSGPIINFLLAQYRTNSSMFVGDV